MGVMGRKSLRSHGEERSWESLEERSWGRRVMGVMGGKVMGVMGKEKSWGVVGFFYVKNKYVSLTVLLYPERNVDCTFYLNVNCC